MRVIAGSARGRPLLGPPRVAGGGKAGVRPTSDLIRGVIFNMLDALGADYSRVLDVYAGTGALGIEALSRGEGEADFVESDGAAAKVIDENLRRMGFAGRGRVHRLTAAAAGARLSGPYTLVLADPPYYDAATSASATGADAAAEGPAAVDVVRALAETALVDGATVFVYEHHRRQAAPEALGPLPLYRERRHGDTVVSIYAREDAE